MFGGGFGEILSRVQSAHPLSTVNRELATNFHGLNFSPTAHSYFSLNISDLRFQKSDNSWIFRIIHFQKSGILKIHAF